MSFPTLAFFQGAAQTVGLTDSALYTPAGGNARAIVGKFTSQYVEPFGIVEAAAPAFSCSQSQFETGDPKQNDAVRITVADGTASSIEYRVKSVKRNTPVPGEVTLILKV